MKNIFRKAASVIASTALVGMTMGIAAAASYPSPFVSDLSNTAIVVGSNAAPSDGLAASQLRTGLDAAAISSGGIVTITTGEIVSIDTAGTRIWLNTSLDTAKSTLTKTDLPEILGDYTFSGNVEAKFTSTIKLDDGVTAGTDNSGKVVYLKQPKSSNDPVVGISMGSTEANHLYNASVTFKATNFTHADSEGESIRLFGKDYVVSTSTSTDSLVLFSSSTEINLVAGGSSPNPTATVVINGTTYSVELITGTSTTATIGINGESKEVTEGSSKKINDIDVAVKSVTESTALDTVTATILVGSDKLTFTDGSTVTRGSNDDPIDGTTAYISGGPGEATSLVISVRRPDSSSDVILPGAPFLDPVFGSFKVDFAGLNIPLEDTSRDIIEIDNSADKGMSISFTDSSGAEASFIFAYNQTYASAQGNTPVYKPANWRLANDNNKSIFVHEGANLTEDDFVVLGNEDYGHLLEVTQIYNNTGTDYTLDKVKLQDVFTDETFDAVFTSECTATGGPCGTIAIDGKSYAIETRGSGDGGYITIKFPTGDSSTTNSWVIYPTMQTEGGNLVGLYEPLQIDLGNVNGTVGTTATVLNFPDGDGYTPVTFTYAGMGNWTVTGAGSGLFSSNSSAAAGDNYTVLTVGQFRYNMTSGSSTAVYANLTHLYLIDPEGDANLKEPSVMVFEKKDDNNKYHGLVVNLETAMAGTSNDGVGVDDILFTQDGEQYHTSSTLASDSDITMDIDWYGTLTTTDAGDSDQKRAIVSVPSEQVFAQIYVSEASAIIGGDATEDGVNSILDTEVGSYPGMNLIVVGGSAINTVAAELLGGAFSEAAFTAQTDVNPGEFLIQSFSRSGKTALLVAGYNAIDTEKAVDYLMNENPNTDIGQKWVGTSSTEASMVIA